jgi:RimJ/RimL family protein N-acetyltransferase
MHHAYLIGKAIYLRPLEPSEAPAVAPWFNDQEVIRFTTRWRPLTVVEEEEYIRKHLGSEAAVMFAIALKESDRLIGVTGLHQIDSRNRVASFGILIGEKDAWNEGHGTEATRLVVQYAFDTVNLHRVWLHVSEFNPRGVRAYEKAGFRHEGRLRQDHFREGRYWDTLVMGVLRDEWRSGKDATDD